MKELQVIPLTREAFAPFGDVIEVGESAEQREINEGHTTRFHDLAKLTLSDQGGQPAINIFRSKPLASPVCIRLMERHPISSQSFMPLSGHPFLVVVAAPGELDPEGITAFLASPNQGVNYHAGTWHHYCLALESTSDFLVVDRIADDENCDEVQLKEPLILKL
jgi:ureidoglycolate lyase